MAQVPYLNSSIPQLEFQKLWLEGKYGLVPKEGTRQKEGNALDTAYNIEIGEKNNNNNML